MNFRLKHQKIKVACMLHMTGGDFGICSAPPEKIRTTRAADGPAGVLA